MAKLSINSGPNQGVQIDLKPGVNRLGRTPDNDVQIEEPSVSSHHCEIFLENETTTIRDLGSTNGTFIDGLQVQEAVLQPGQKLQLGSVEMSFDSDAPVRVTVSTEPHVVPTPTLPAGMSPCKNHAMNPAEWLCSRCHQLYCNACVQVKTVRTKQVPCCRTCGSQCTRFGLGVFARPEEKRSFFSQLPEVFMYPFKGNGLILLIGGAIFLCIMEFLTRRRGFALGIILATVRLMMTVILGGYLFSYMQRIIQSSAQGDEEMPSWPEFGDFWNDIIRPFLQGLVICVPCLGPGIVALGMGIAIVVASPAFGPPPPSMILTMLALGVVGLAGFLYFPMALLAVAMADSLGGLNPFVVIPSIFRVPAQYLVTCCVLLGVFIVRTIGILVLQSKILPLPIIPTLLSSFLSLYFLVVVMRLLGVLYFTNKDRLKWF